MLAFLALLLAATPAWADISIVGVASNNAINSDDVTVTLPVGTAQNDVVYCAYMMGSNGDQTGTLAENSGTYTALGTAIFADDNEDVNLQAYRKVQGVSPDASVTFAGGANIANSVAAACIVLRGVDTTTPEDATTVNASASNAAVPDPGAITTVTNNAWVIAFGASSTSDVFTATAPTNYENIVEDQGADTHDSSIMGATRLIAVAGAENPGAFGGVTSADPLLNAWAAKTIAVRPAATVSDSGLPPCAGCGVFP